MATLHIILLIIFVVILLVDSQTAFDYVDFKLLPNITLPTPLQQHISAVYNDKLFIFGGRNGTSNDAVDSITYYPKAWSLDLTQLNLVLSSTKNDIDQSVINRDLAWQELTIIPPTYGPSWDGIIRCQSQCYTQIDKYLYIVAPYGKNDEATTGAVYRIDLSLNPPAFSAQNDFSPSIFSVYGANVREVCTTSSADGSSIYVLGGNKGALASSALSDFVLYNTSTDTWSKLTSMNQERQASGCAVNFNNEEVYIFGGSDPDGTRKFGSAEIDTYFASTETWTDNTGYNQPEFPFPIKDIRCIQNLYDETIMCPGGYATGAAYIHTIIYKTGSKEIIDTIFLANATASYGIATYEFVNDGTDQAFIVLVSGGRQNDINVLNQIQYTVVYNTPTLSPTPSPTDDPTISPSNAPSQPPTSAPTDNPTQPPSNAPTEYYETTLAESTIPVTRSGTVGSKQTTPIGVDKDTASLQTDLFIGILLSIIVVFIL